MRNGENNRNRGSEGKVTMLRSSVGAGDGGLQERLDALSKDPFAEFEIRRMEGIVVNRDSSICLKSELEWERAGIARSRGEPDASGAKRGEPESQAGRLKCDIGNERVDKRAVEPLGVVQVDLELQVWAQRRAGRRPYREAGGGG